MLGGGVRARLGARAGFDKEGRDVDSALHRRGQVRVIAALIAVLALLGVASCRGAATSGTANQAGTYSIGNTILPSQMANMNPLLLTGNSPTVLQYLYNHLFYFNPVSGKTGPELATDGAWSDHDLVYTVTLNSKAKWSNGKPITAQDVVYTYTALHNPTLDRYGIWSYLQSVKAQNGKVVFQLQHPFVDFPTLLTTVYIIPHSLTNPTTNRNLQPVSSGPWKFDAYHTGTNVVLSANPYSFMGRPHFKYLNIEMYTTNSATTLALQNGTIETGGSTVGLPSLPSLMKVKTNKLQKYPGFTNYSVLMNNKVAGLDDTNVRRAIALAIDPSVLINQVEMGVAYPGNPGWLPALFSSDLDQQIFTGSAYKFNLNAARSLLQQAGYTPGSDGIMEKQGHPLSFTYYEGSGAPAQEKEASLIQGWLKQIGIATQPRQVAGPEMTQLASTGQYQLLQNGIAMPPSPALAICTVFDSQYSAPIGQATKGLNYVRFQNAQLDSICNQLLSGALSPTKQQSLYKQAQTIIANNAPVAMMYNVGAHIVYRTDKFVGYDTSYPVDSDYSLVSVHSRPKSNKKTNG